MNQRLTIRDLQKKKKTHRKITMLTAYNHPTAEVLDQAGMDLLLVGDSMGNVILGEETTLPVTLDLSLALTKAVVRGAKRALVVGDMPFLSYQLSKNEAVRNAGRYLQEAGASAVKIEGGSLRNRKLIRRLTETGIPVMGHLGLTPQSIHQLGGYRQQGKTPRAQKELMETAEALERAGCFALVLECIPKDLAEKITKKLSIPTIGIGSGPETDGQVLVFHDLVGLSSGPVPGFVRPRGNLRRAMKDMVQDWAREVRGESDHPSALAPKVPYRVVVEKRLNP